MNLNDRRLVQIEEREVEIKVPSPVDAIRFSHEAIREVNRVITEINDELAELKKEILEIKTRLERLEER